jgi:hypothetical protein
VECASPEILGPARLGGFLARRRFDNDKAACLIIHLGPAAVPPHVELCRLTQDQPGLFCHPSPQAHRVQRCTATWRQTFLLLWRGLDSEDLWLVGLGGLKRDTLRSTQLRLSA